MLKYTTAFAAALLLSAGTAPAQSIIFNSGGDNERYYLPVYPISASAFEVVNADFASPAAMWCAAAKYVDRYVPGDIRQLWVAKALSSSENEPRRNSMVFSIEPTPTESRSLLFGTRTVGLTKSMAAADSVCYSSDFTVVLKVK